MKEKGVFQSAHAIPRKQKRKKKEKRKKEEERTQRHGIPALDRSGCKDNQGVPDASLHKVIKSPSPALSAEENIDIYIYPKLWRIHGPPLIALSCHVEMFDIPVLGPQGGRGRMSGGESAHLARKE